MVGQKVIKAVWLQFLSVQINVEEKRRCLASQLMTSEGIVVLMMGAIAFAKQVQKTMELAIWFQTIAIDCTSSKLNPRVKIGVKLFPALNSYHILNPSFV